MDWYAAIATLFKHESVRLLAVGVITFVVYIGTFHALSARKVLPLHAAIGVAFILWLALSFALQKFWAFDTSNANVHEALKVFVCKSGLIYLATALLVPICVTRWGRTKTAAMLYVNTLTYVIDYAFSLWWWTQYV